MKTKLLLAGASALALTWASSTQAENVGIGVLEPQAVLHVAGEVGNADDVIFQNLNAYDGAANTENVLLVDEDDGQRVKTIPLTDLLTDTTLANSAFSFDTGTNVLSITEGGTTLTVDLSTLSDTLNFTDTNTVISTVTYNAGTITITDSAGDTFPVDISAVDTTLINSALTFDDATNVLSITEGGTSLTVDLSDLQDTLTDANTTIVSFDYAPDTNILSIVDSEFNQFDVDLTELQDSFTDINLANSNLVQPNSVSTRTYNINGNTLEFDNGNVIVGHVTTSTPLQSYSQANSTKKDDGYLSAPWIYSSVLESPHYKGTLATLIAVGPDGYWNTQNHEVSIVTQGVKQFRVRQDGSLFAPTYGKGDTQVVGSASNDYFLTVNSSGKIREVSAPVDTTISNTAATLDGSNVLTITDEAGDVTVDLSALSDTDTTIANTSATLDGSNVLTITDEAGDVTVDLSGLAVTLSDTTVSNTAATLDGATNILTITDETGDVTVDLSALSDTDTTIANTSATLDGSNILTITDEAGEVTVDLSGLAVTLSDTTVSNTAATLDGATNVLTITDETGDVTVDLSALSDTDTTISNTAATLDGATNILTITDETSDVTVDLSALSDTDTDTTISNTAATLDGANILTITDETGDVTVDLSALSDTDTTVSNTAAALDGANILTITDETGDVTVDLSALSDTDTTISNTAATLDGANILTITDETGDVTVDLSALSDTDTDTTISNTAATLDGANILTITDETGDVTVDLSALSDTDTTIANTSATLDGSNVLTITDEAGDVTVDLSGLAVTLSDTTVSNTAATLDGATNVLTITDETGDVTVDLSSIDTDTTDLDWAVSSTASDLATGITDNIYTNGNVGINTNAPSYPLVVDTAATQNALVVREATEGGQTLGRVGVGTDTPGYSLDVSGDIRATGSIYSGDQFLASNFFQTSDRRLKTEIEGFNRGLEILRQLRLVSYRYNGMGLPTNTERLHYGVIAQELQAIDPELVGSFYSPEDNMDYLTVNVQSMTYVLANAIQQLDAENARMTAVLLDSEARITRLEKRLRLMEARLGVSDQ